MKGIIDIFRGRSKEERKPETRNWKLTSSLLRLSSAGIFLQSKKTAFTALAFFLALLPGASFAATVDLPQTGQTTCYDVAGAIISCTDTGQDSDILAGVEWPGTRFTGTGDGTITDNLTGLVWLKNANCFGPLTWASALTSANNLTSGSCGLTDGSSAGDWRLPNRRELRSLVNYEVATPSTWLSGLGFTNVQPSYYWTSTTYVGSPTYAWAANLDDDLSLRGDIFSNNVAN